MNNIERNLEVLREKCCRLNKEIQDLKNENESLKKVKESYKRKYMEEDTEFKSLQKLNNEFQLTMIDKMKERDGIIKMFKIISSTSCYKIL